MTVSRRADLARTIAALLGVSALLVGCRSDRDRKDHFPSGPQPVEHPGAEETPPEDDPRAKCDPEVVAPGSSGAVARHRNVLGVEPEPVHVRLGWPSFDPSTSVAFVWGTDADTFATVVEYGSGDTLDQRAFGGSYRFGSRDGNVGSDRIHEVKLCDLEAATTYRYRVGGAGVWSDTHEFTTPGPPGTFDSFRVAVAGDSRGGVATWSEVLAAIDEQEPDFLLFSGDFVNDGDDPAQWHALFEVTGDVLARRVLLPAHGNHEILADDYFAQFSLPGNEQWFSYVYGDLQLVVLNDTVVTPTDLEVTQPAYLDRAFGRTSAPWRMVMHHRSAWSASTLHGSAEDVRAAWVPRFEEHGVDLVVAGHNHVYERSVPILRGAEVAPGEGPTYLTSGGAGADLYEGFDAEWFSRVAVTAQHYVIVDFGPDKLHAVVRDLAGNVIDEFTLPR